MMPVLLMTSAFFHPGFFINPDVSLQFIRLLYLDFDGNAEFLKLLRPNCRPAFVP